MHIRPSRAGWSLVEIFVAIGIIAVLIALAVPVVGRARASAQLAVCMSNQRQILQAVLQYTTDHRGLFPPSPSQQATSSNTTAKWGDPNVLQIAASPSGWASVRQYINDPHVLLCPLGPKDASAMETALANNPPSIAHSYYLLWNFNRSGPQVPVNAGYIGRHHRAEKKGSELLIADATREKSGSSDTIWYSPHSWGDVGTAKYGLWKMASPPPSDVVFNGGYVDGSVRRYTHKDASGHASYFIPSTKYWLPPERMD